MSWWLRGSFPELGRRSRERPSDRLAVRSCYVPMRPLHPPTKRRARAPLACGGDLRRIATGDRPVARAAEGRRLRCKSGETLQPKHTLRIAARWKCHEQLTTVVMLAMRPGSRVIRTNSPHKCRDAGTGAGGHKTNRDQLRGGNPARRSRTAVSWAAGSLSGRIGRWPQGGRKLA
jgi:hypothetical protein